VFEGLATLRELAGEGSGGGGGAAAGAAPRSSGSGGGPVPAAAAAAPAPAPAPAVDRCLQVLLPVASDIDVDASFFERTPAEVRAEYARMAARRRAGEVLMTRGQREAAAAAAAAGRAPRPAHAAVRVRFPEVRRCGAGCVFSPCLPACWLPPLCASKPTTPPPTPAVRLTPKQGVQLAANFGLSEPLCRVHETVADALRAPARAFELVLPDRRPLPREGRVADAGIAPAVLLNFRGLDGGSGGGGGGGDASLSDEKMGRATVEW
jgi:hypothetical protein